jgi:predicted flap endonuclease-1-like 5' DNA nuclease
MDFIDNDPIFFWLIWGVVAMAGVVFGWSLRGGTYEKDVRAALGRMEQEKNTLARLYTHIKHQHDLREADFRRASLEVEKLRSRVHMLEDERALLLPDAPQNAARIADAENAAAQYAQKVTALEVLTNSLRAQNGALSAQLAYIKKEMGDWNTLYQGFKQTQERLAEFEQKAIALEQERNALHTQLAQARAEMELLQTELLQRAESPAAKGKGSRKGGVAAPQVDDLNTIKGMGPFVERLQSMGISTFSQISRWDDDTIIAVAKSLDISPGKIYRDDWVGQALRLSSERR